LEAVVGLIEVLFEDLIESAWVKTSQLHLHTHSEGVVDLGNLVDLEDQIADFLAHAKISCLLAGKKFMTLSLRGPLSEVPSLRKDLPLHQFFFFLCQHGRRSLIRARH
jgi:hypothetical protein